jgi:hypothetical protein
MNTFEITIQRKAGQSWPVVTEYSRMGVLLPTRAEGVLTLEPEDFQALTSLLGQPQAYGARLGQALLAGDILYGPVPSKCSSAITT